MSGELLSMCLPKGTAMKPLAQLLDEIEFPIREYHSRNRSYRPDVEGLPVRSKIMAEKDVPIQIAAGNYDMGFCGLDWLLEHTIRYRAANTQVLKHLRLDRRGLYVCSGLDGDIGSLVELHTIEGFVTIVSEYPNLAESFAIKERLGKFKVFSAWGNVEAYPPEHADVILLAVDHSKKLKRLGLRNILDTTCYLESDLCLVVNRRSFLDKDLSPVLKFFTDMEP
jgi:ATP phosphoribosyltransferase